MTYEFIESNGTKYPVRYGFWALSNFCKLANLTLAELNTLGSNMTMEQAIALVYAGLQDGHRKANLSFSLDTADVADLLDEAGDLLKKCVSIFSEHQGKPLKKNNRKETKGRVRKV